jgi:glycosyltransferase involved in cell wall biosynthesis
MREPGERILVFIPAYRCQAQVVRVLDQFDPRVQALVDTVMVIDNQSPDDTLACAIERGRTGLPACRFIAWRNDANYGLGGSHKAAFRYAVEHGFDYLIVLHGDDQADIRDAVRQLEKGEHREVDCLLGARFMRGSELKGYSAFRTFGNRVYNAVFSVAARRGIHDLGSGLNVYRLAAFREFYYKGFPDDLTFNYVMLLASYARQQRVKYFPITWREEDQVSNVRLFRQASKVMLMLLEYLAGPTRFLSKDMRPKAFEAYSGNIVFSRAAGERSGDE